MIKVAACIYSLLTAWVATFQLALAVGFPWGEAAWGGQFSGILPTPMRFVSLCSALLLVLFSAIILARARLLQTSRKKHAGTLSWIVVAFCALSVLSNSVTPSFLERVVWLPVAAIMLVAAFIVANNQAK